MGWEQKKKTTWVRTGVGYYRKGGTGGDYLGTYGVRTEEDYDIKYLTTVILPAPQRVPQRDDGGSLVVHTVRGALVRPRRLLLRVPPVLPAVNGASPPLPQRIFRGYTAGGRNYSSWPHLHDTP